MAAGWVHQTHDLIVFGRTYAGVHWSKDAASQNMPGRRHRAVGHEYYLRYLLEWDLDCPFPETATRLIQEIRESSGPEVAEQRISSDGHDVLDRVWDELCKEKRLYWEGFFAWLIYQPQTLQNWAGVDVIGGIIKRTVDGNEVWEDSPETASEYRALRREVSRHQKWRLRDVLARYT